MPGSNDAQHRLTDFEIEEVSAVDHAANAEKFVIVKSEAGDAESDDKEPKADGEKAEDEAKPEEGEEQSDGEKADDDRDDEEAPADGEKADDDEGKESEADEEKADGDDDEEAPAEDGEKAGDEAKPDEDDGEKAKGDDPEPDAETTDSAKSAPAHSALLNEQAGALKGVVDSVVSAATKEGDFKMAMERLDHAWSLLSAMRSSANVVNLMKAAGPIADPFASIERTILDKKSELIVAKEGEAPAEGGEAQDPLSMIMARLESIEAKVDALAEGQAKAETTKALAILQKRVTLVESGINAPTTAGAGGAGRSNAKKNADRVEWPADLNEG